MNRFLKIAFYNLAVIVGLISTSALFVALAYFFIDLIHNGHTWIAGGIIFVSIWMLITLLMYVGEFADGSERNTTTGPK